MKKILVIVVLLFAIMAQNIFAQTTASEWFEKAGEYLTNGDWNNAITAYTQVISRDSSNLDAYWLRGHAHSQVGNYDAAITDFNIVVKGAPDFQSVYMQRGFSYGGKRMYHKAIADYRTGLEKGYDPTGGGWSVANSPNVPSSMWLLGLIHMEIVVNRFLGNSAVVTRNENLLRTLCNDTNVTRAEIETFFRNGIRGLISDIVDEEFRGVTVPADTLIGVKKVIGDFYLSPTQTTYNLLRRERLVLASKKLIIQSHNTILNAELFGLTRNDEGIRDLVNTMNNSKEQLRELTGENFDPVNERTHNYDPDNFMRVLGSLSRELGNKIRAETR